MEEKRQEILIVDDNEINRSMLAAMLQQAYRTVEVENGQQALDVIRQDKASVTAVLLDIIMPVMDGYEFLEKIKALGIDNIPIIVMTGDKGAGSEEKALEMGAWDFVSKPYQMPILMTRLKNAIARSEVSYLKKIRHLAEHDTVTDLYNRRYFFEETETMLRGSRGDTFAFIRMDIKRFRMVNALKGEQGGNELLRYMARNIDKCMKKNPLCTYGHIEADIFGICMQYEADKCDRLTKKLTEIFRNYSTEFIIEPAVGIYIIEDNMLSAETIYLRASLAANTLKDKYKVYSAYYDNSMGEKLFEEQEILAEADEAFAKEQFRVYLQPKFNVQTKRPYGAEALVRWEHPVKGRISPAEFIPVFERNGLIRDLDYYMWDHVCALLRKWIDEGKHPAPISVNMSRMDVENAGLFELLQGLLDRYQLPPELLNLELTESAYMEDPKRINEVIRKLHEMGFIIMMDDFGSGYSSLNTLKDFDVDIIKIDMKFLPVDSSESKSKKILTSVVRMAGWLKLPVVMEGVETKEQSDFLTSIGCEYIQGYYFARPMPVEEYEKLVKDVDQLEAVLNEDMLENNYANRIPHSLKKKIYGDTLTDAYNRRYLTEWLFLDMGDFSEEPHQVGIIMCDLKNFKTINNNYGYELGNEILKKTVALFLSLIRKQDSVIRYGGDEFLLILVNCPEEILKGKISEIAQGMSELKLTGAEDLDMQIDMGYAYSDRFEKKADMLREMILEAEKNMYMEKARTQKAADKE
ncbi:MAG: EAL domain-containing protein [Butyrivibrio sp.]|nr:EAL domain-containing protein [Butyrivibrio sp.]